MQCGPHSFTYALSIGLDSSQKGKRLLVAVSAKSRLEVEGDKYTTLHKSTFTHISCSEPPYVPVQASLEEQTVLEEDWNEFLLSSLEVRTLQQTW